MYTGFYVDISFNLWINTTGCYRVMDHTVRVCLVLKETTKWSSTVVYSFAFLPATNESSCFPHPCQCLMLSVSWILAILISVKWLVSRFNFLFPDDIWCGSSFHVLICHLYIIFGERSVKVFAHFLTELFAFVLLSCLLYIWIADFFSF